MKAFLNTTILLAGIFIFQSCYQPDKLLRQGGLRIEVQYTGDSKDTVNAQSLIESLTLKLQNTTGRHTFYTKNKNGNYFIDLLKFNDKDSVAFPDIWNLDGGNDTIGFWETLEASEIFPNLEKLNRELSYDPFIKQFSFDNDSMKSAFNQNPLFTLLVPATYQTDNGPEFRRGPCIGYVKKEHIDLLFKLIDYGQEKNFFLPDFFPMLTYKPTYNTEDIYELIAVRDIMHEGQPFMTNDMVNYSNVEEKNESTIYVRLNNEGGLLFKKYTARNIGKSLAITINRRVISYPTVQMEITGGNVSITGNFTEAEAAGIVWKINFSGLGKHFKIKNVHLYP